ncbi:hypothetical protein M514_21428 [Trichuris suis]|uniref:Uncharacterized protein n=1 Tax=Trichuris suis TaxID=68888 RepID=A0A085NAA2_9BILA|nr:hypothetical protein M514_21428 [Trichuris suis]
MDVDMNGHKSENKIGICEAPVVSSASVEKNTRKVITKLNIIALHENGKPVIDIAHELDQVIVEEDYLPKQIFNVNEKSWFWKRMPERTYIQQRFKAMPGNKSNNHGNAAFGRKCSRIQMFLS